VVLHLLRDVLDPSWAPGPAADRLATRVHDAEVLRHARARLRGVTAQRTTVWQARALATLNMAITKVEDGQAPHGEDGHGGGPGEQARR